MIPSSVTLSAEPSASERKAIVDGLLEYNAQHGYGELWRDLSLVLRDAGGGVIGGLIGETNKGWLFVKALWVDEPHRGEGFGGQLLAAAESAARERACIGVYLDTYSYQARPFYEKAGYAVFGELPDHPPGGAKYYLAKRIDH